MSIEEANLIIQLDGYFRNGLIASSHYTPEDYKEAVETILNHILNQLEKGE